MNRLFFRLTPAVLACALLTGCGFEAITPESTPAGEETSLTPQPDQTIPNAGTTPNASSAAEPGPAPSVPAQPETPKQDSVLIADVPHLDQSTGYATACESLAAVSLLQFYGVDIDPGTFIKEHLPVADYPYDSNGDGILEAESPWDYFIGDPLKSNGYGCYSPAVKKAIDSVRPGIAQLLRDVPLSVLCRDYIDKGQPVMLWATIEMQPARDGHTWELPDGELFTYTRPEHALLLVGYDAHNYYFSDSLCELPVIFYEKSAVETAYRALFQQAIVIQMPE